MPGLPVTAERSYLSLNRNSNAPTNWGPLRLCLLLPAADLQLRPVSARAKGQRVRGVTGRGQTEARGSATHARTQASVTSPFVMNPCHTHPLTNDIEREPPISPFSVKSSN